MRANYWLNKAQKTGFGTSQKNLSSVVHTFQGLSKDSKSEFLQMTGTSLEHSSQQETIYIDDYNNNNNNKFRYNQQTLI